MTFRSTYLFGRLRVILCSLLLVGFTARSETATTFGAAQAAYERGDYAVAAQTYSELISNAPSAGVLLNLGNAEWQQGQVTPALLAWERALLLAPRDPQARNNLQFVREIAQLDSPDLTWGEIAAAWLPAASWAWLACGSLWLAISLAILPPVLRWRKTGWQQAGMALGLGVFLLSLPANIGAVTRTKIGFVREAETPVSLTPTAEGEALTRLAAGEPGRVLRTHGGYLLIQTRLTSGWVEREKFSLICPD